MGVSHSILEGYSSWVNIVTFLPDGQLLTSILGNKIVRLWKAKIGVLHSILKGYSSLVNIVAFSPDG